MNKYYFILLFSGSWHVTIAQSQQITASVLLDSISKSSFQANFTYRPQQTQGQLEAPWKGKIAGQGHQYCLTLPEQEIISNGQTVWTYLKAANEVQIAHYDAEQVDEAPWTILMNYHQNYVVHAPYTQQIDGQACNVVVLIAKDTKNCLQKVTLMIEPNTKHIKQLEALDSNHVLHTFLITDFMYNPGLAKDFFNFSPDAYQGIEIIDMR
ncbi:MAG: LolA family protein [Bacteroidota bacterium]